METLAHAFLIFFAISGFAIWMFFGVLYALDVWIATSDQREMKKLVKDTTLDNVRQ